MSLKIKKPESNFVLPEEGEHLARLLSYEDQGEQEDIYNPGQLVHRVQLIWKLKGGSEQYQWCKVSMHPMSKLYEVAQALLQADPPDELDLDELVGKQAILTLEHYTGKDKRKKSKVVDIRPTAFKGRKLQPPMFSESPKTEAEAEAVEEESDDVPF